MEDMIAIATFYYQHEIVVLKNLLDTAQIRYFFENEHTLGVAPFYAQAIGGIVLKVASSDVIRAQEILSELNTDD